VEEVLRRIEANNLYIKLAKCMWKVKEIDFLGLVMGIEGIKIQEEKVVEVLEWPKPKIIKDVQKFLLHGLYTVFPHPSCDPSCDCDCVM